MRRSSAMPGGNSSSDKLVEIVSGADQRPFCGGFIDAAQQNVETLSPV